METSTETTPASIPAMRERKWLINPQVAREYQQRATEARRHNVLAKKIAETSEARLSPNDTRVAMVERHLAKVASLMDKATDANEWLKLSAARANLFREWQVLTGTPNPGARKAGRNAKPAPIQPEPIPANEGPKV